MYSLPFESEPAEFLKVLSRVAIKKKPKQKGNMLDDALSRMSLTEISGAIAKREVSSREVVQNNLEILEQQGTS
ncbi:MAG: hypothetical protein CM1200mP30_11210 [Pseudomonadota bacterium]|nr:MAG: hypothetical protein CM1200mP30_11210 [Pseudomonadota bacterium]